MSNVAPSLTGRFAEDGTHRYPLRVYYEDTDAGGIVYHANYLRFAERARTEMLYLMGFRQKEMAEGLGDVTGVSFAVRRLTIDFDAPAKLRTRLKWKPESSISAEPPSQLHKSSAATVACWRAPTGSWRRSTGPGGPCAFPNR